MTLMGGDLLRYSNKIESGDLRKCPYDQTNKAYLIGNTVRNIYESFTNKMAAKKPAGVDMERNYVTW